MTFAKDDLIEALRLRYDHYSAQSVFELARERASLADKPAYDASELRAWRDGVAKVGDRVTGVLARIDALLAGGVPAPKVTQADLEPRADKPAEPRAKAPKADARPPASEPTSAPRPEPALEVAAVPPTKPKIDPKIETKIETKIERKIETTIVLRGVETADGDQVLVCGTSLDLGDWDPAHARPMARAGDEWRTIVSVDAKAPLAFKFLRRAPDGTITWEGGDNREVPAAERIEATWR